MAENSKAIGLRLPSDVWDKLREYGLEHYPSDKSKEGIDVTQSITTLLKQALGISLDDYVMQSNTTLDEHITAIVRRLLDDVTNPLRDELAEVVEFSRNLQGEIVKVKKLLANDSSSRKLRVEVQHAIASKQPETPPKPQS